MQCRGMAAAQTRKCWDTCKREYADSFCRLAEVLLAFSNGILTLVTFGTPFWLEQEFQDENRATILYHSGLWQNCTLLLGCVPIPVNVPAYSIASRLFMVLALASGIAAWVATIVALLQHKARWLVCSAVAYAIQAFLMMIGLSAYSVAYHKGTGEPSWSYHAGWIACVLSVACAVYYVSVAIFRLRNPSVLPPGGQPKTYAPLAQFESTGTDDEEDEDM